MIGQFIYDDLSKDIQAMNLEKYGKPNPNAPKEFSHFAFMVIEAYRLDD